MNVAEDALEAIGIARIVFQCDKLLVQLVQVLVAFFQEVCNEFVVIAHQIRSEQHRFRQT